MENKNIKSHLSLVIYMSFCAFTTYLLDGDVGQVQYTAHLADSQLQPPNHDVRKMERTQTALVFRRHPPLPTSQQQQINHIASHLQICLLRHRHHLQTSVNTRCWSAAITALLFLGIKVQSGIITVGRGCRCIQFLAVVFPGGTFE